MALAFLSYTVRKTLSEPAILFVLILQGAIILFVALGLSFEYQGMTLLSISLMGKEGFGGENLLLVRQMIGHFVQLGWMIFMFLFMIGASPSFSELLRDPLLNILLTKSYSRTVLLLFRYCGVVATIGAVQLVFSLLLVLVFLVKTKILFLWIIPPLVVAPVLHFLTLAALGACLGVLFEQPTAVTVVVLAVYYLNPTIAHAIALQDPLLQIASYLFPPLSSIDRFFVDLLLYKSSDVTLQFHSVLYAIFYLVVGSVLFNKRDL